MTIKTKFNVGDSVFFIKDGKVQQIEITDIRIDINKNDTNIEYIIGNSAFNYDICKEELLFSTKEELINSL